MKHFVLILAIAIPSFEQAILTLTGAGSIEDLDESTVETYEHRREHPLDINCPSRGKIEACGLLSSYQTASLLDYRERCGDIRSLSELAAVDGFTAELAAALAPFIYFGDSARERGKGGVHCSLMQRAGLKTTFKPPENSCSWGLKYSIEFGGTAEIKWSTRGTYSSPGFTPGTVSACIYGRKHLGKLVIGDFNARFGQGLAVWSGFSMSGFSSAAAFQRNGSGISPSGSYTEAFRGIAADWNTGRWSFTAAASHPGIGILNATIRGKTFNAGITACYRTPQGSTPAYWCCGMDFRAGFKGGAVFGEVAAGSGATTRSAPPAAVLGVLLTPAYGLTISALARYYPEGYAGTFASAARSSTKTNDEHGVSAGLQAGGFGITLDASRHRAKASSHYKAISFWSKQFTIGKIVTITPEARAVAKWHPQDKNQLRLEGRGGLAVSAGEWKAKLLGNLVRCEQLAWEWYAEAGYCGPFTIYARAGLFKVDKWDDRIYVYERDAPGNFNCPAYYGRGWNASLCGGWKSPFKAGAHFRHELYLRASIIAYPWTEGKKNVAEAKLQYILSIK